jgi:hypothetical protein
MGFFDRFAKSFRGKSPEPVKQVDDRAYSSLSLYPPSKSSAATAVAVHDYEPAPSLSSTAVALEDPPEIDELPVFQAEVPVQENNLSVFDADLDSDLDDVFASLMTQETLSDNEPVAAETLAEDQSAVETLFADIAANYARPVKNFIFELKRGTATKDWTEICRPAMHGITRAAEGMGLTQAAQRMVDFEAALSLAQNSEERLLRGDVRDLILWCYEDLIKVMPQAFLVGEEEQQREGIIIDSLLKQIPDVGRVTIDKLYRAGLTSLDTLYLAKRDDLAVATGITTSLSERICEKFQAYRTRLENTPRDLSGERDRLALMLTELRRHHEGFQYAAANEWSDPALATEKRDCRQQRQSCVLWINVLLAEVGELDLINELEKLSFDRRIERLEEYLASPPASM